MTEFGNAARLVKLDERIAEQMRERATPNENLDAMVRKVGQVTERIINRFVAEMDFDRRRPSVQIAEFGEDLLRPVFTARPIQYDVAELPADRRGFRGGIHDRLGSRFSRHGGEERSIAQRRRSTIRRRTRVLARFSGR